MHVGVLLRVSSWVSRSSSIDSPYEYAEEVRFATADLSVREMCNASTKKGQQNSARNMCESLMFREDGEGMLMKAHSSQ